MRTLMLSLSLVGLLAAAVRADEVCKEPPPGMAVETCGSADCCGHCGCHGCCEKYCRVVCEMKEVKKHVWVVKCSDFCAPLPRCGRGGCDCCDCCGDSCSNESSCCDACNAKCDPCAAEKNKCIVPPKCGKVREKKTLEKKEITCKVPTYKCVVVYACPKCSGNHCDTGKAAPAPAESAAPPAPAPSPEKTTWDAPLPPALNPS